MTARQILLLSAYRADSHAAWADWLQRSLTGFRWRTLELPGRHFRWRIRGNPLSWLDALAEEPAPDLILATSMVDLSTIRGLHPHLAGVPAWYYFHENQFVHPVSDRQVKSVEPQIVQVYGALCADRLLFNSAFNRDSFLEGVKRLLHRMPDHAPRGVADRLRDKCQLCPVPVTPIAPAPERDERLILWSHRWEYDKQPEVFARAMVKLADRGVAFRLALLGARHREPGEALQLLRKRLGDRIVADGKLSGQAYHEVVGRAGIAVSTARHELQGLAMLEAASAGVRPLVPDHLCYPEQYSSCYRYPADDMEALVRRLEQWLDEGLPPAPDVSAWSGAGLRSRWEQLLAEGAGGKE